jgi:hypothetical protein
MFARWLPVHRKTTQSCAKTIGARAALGIPADHVATEDSMSTVDCYWIGGMAAPNLNVVERSWAEPAPQAGSHNIENLATGAKSGRFG